MNSGKVTQTPKVFKTLSVVGIKGVQINNNNHLRDNKGNNSNILTDSNMEVNNKEGLDHNSIWTRQGRILRSILKSKASLWRSRLKKLRGKWRSNKGIEVRKDKEGNNGNPPSKVGSEAVVQVDSKYLMTSRSWYRGCLWSLEVWCYLKFSLEVKDIRLSMAINTMDLE